MTTRRPSQTWTGVALTALVPMFLLAVPASAQESARGSYGPGAGGGGGSASAGGSSGGGGSVSSGGSSGGGSSSMSSGGSVSSGGGGSPFSGSGGGPSGVRSIDGGGRAAATGGGGVAVGRAVHGSGSDSYRSSSGASSYTDYTSGRVLSSEPGTRFADSNGTAPRFSRPRDGAPAAGSAVPRGSVPTTGNGISYVTGYGYGYPGYYNGYGYYPYDPSFGYLGSLGYGFGGSLYGGYVDPMYGGSMIGSAYTDPWYGGSNSTQSGSSSSSSEDSALRLKIKPSNGEVFVDGYFVGVVNDFDGMFQRLRIEPGPHRVEVRAPGYETLDIDVRLTSGKTTIYQGELKKIQ